MPATDRVTVKRKPLTSKEITVTLGIKKLFIPGLIVICVLIIGFVIWQLLPAREVEKHCIAVISFENQTGNSSYDYLQKAIPNLLITNLEQSKYLSVTTWERLHDLLKQKGKEDVEFIDSDLGFELCRQEHIKALVLGSFVRAGDAFVTDVKVFDVETKNLVKSANKRGRGVQSILENQIDDLSQFYYDSLHGEILLAKNRNEEVISSNRNTRSIKIPGMLTWSLLKYNQLFLRDQAARAYQKKGDLDSAISEYERLISFDPEREERRLVHPKCHYRLAKLYRQKGWEGKAIEHYAKFLDLWRDADPGLAEVEDARRRLARLKGE
jgi:tetratricopeptide (TPR) repeat protein